MTSRISERPSQVIAIAAMDENRVIGYQGHLPWHVPNDLQRFHDLTTGHTVLMGRKTYDSLPERIKPLPDRFSVVATKDPGSIPTHPLISVTTSAEDFIRSWRTRGRDEQGSGERPSILWVIGGEEIYRVTKTQWDELELTCIDGAHLGDAYFPPFEDDFRLASRVPSERCSFYHYVKKK